jgi:hypothetical protein
MAISYINQTDVSADEDMGTINRQRPTRVITEVKSSPAGVDWQMIRIVRAGGGTRRQGEGRRDDTQRDSGIPVAGNS